MFGKKNKLDPNTTDTLIGEGTLFEGNIRSEASIRIEGQITGDIECKGDVTIGDKGSANSNISARNVIIAGIVKGNILAKEKLTITSSGELYGNTTSKVLTIEDGGIFMGHSKMEGKTQAKSEQSEVSSFNSPNPNYNDSAANM